MTTNPAGNDPAATPGGGNPPPAPSWLDALPAEDKGYLQTKGWADPDAGKAATQLVKSYREYERFRGVPQDRILAIPTQGNEEEQRAFWQRLGAPKEAAEYAFEGVDFGDEATNTRFLDAFRSTASRLNMPKDMAAEFAKDVFKAITDHGAAEQAQTTATIAAERAKLEQDWGGVNTPAFAANMRLADLGAAAAGFTTEEVAQLASIKGGAAITQKFRDLAIKLGEDKFVVSPNQNGGKTELMTREQAIDRYAELTGVDMSSGQPRAHPTRKGDKDWMAKLNRGDASARRELADLQRLITGIAA